MEKVRAKRICIIGAGVSGLPCIKQCLEEGLEPVCYERTAHIGGLWNYRTDLGENAATVMKSTVVNTSKEMMAYSDFPPPADWPNFMHNTYVNQYLHLYANHFKLVHHIHFNTAVESVERAANGKWWVALSTGQQELFDGVMLCTGHHATPFVPNFKGLEEFEGRVLHSQRYRDYKGFEDKKVLIIGIGNSALDCAVELSRVTQKLYVSTRKGSWIWNRVAQGGMPYDIIFLSRIYHFLQNGPFVPWSLTN
uniref:Flavin-containing monooxygenase n=1 Tax=Plectus sambesii TaxID=2011161 RepID=A0A914XEZ2_9BILA